MNDFTNKKIVILGFGKEGKSTYNYIRKYEKELLLTIMDKNFQNIILDDPFVEITDVDLNCLRDYDMIFKSPGIDFKFKDISAFRDKITSQLEYFLSKKKGFTIGVTGTKGKSTTSSLIYALINEQGKKAFLVGNIGNPILDIMDDVDSDTYVVIEMSSHQLHYVDISPRIGIILNLFEEHLDHYDSLDEYYEAKLNIARYQGEDDYFLYSSDNEDLANYKKRILTSAHHLDINFNKNDGSYTYLLNDDVYVNGKYVFAKNDERKILGDHNLKDIMFALTVCDILKLDFEKAKQTIAHFEGLMHRMEKVGTFNDITYYNDSIATIPEATINAVKSLPNVNTLILGGMDRGIDYQGLITFLKNSPVENFICMPDTGKYFFESLKAFKKVYEANDVKEAAIIAKKVTKKGMSCLLSPAASSYNTYKNFEERGNAFKDAVKMNVGK